MKHVLTLVAVSTLALAACSEESTQTPAEPNNPVVPTPNPLDVIPDDDPVPVTPDPINPTPVDPTPVDPGPVEPTPVDPAPVVPTPVNPTPVNPDPINPTPVTPPDSPDEPSGDVSGLINGADVNSAQDFWYCADSASQDPMLLVILGDGQALIGDGSQSELLSWENTGPYVNLYYQNQFYGQLDEILISADQQDFSAVYTIYDGSTGDLSCTRVELEDGSDTDGSDDSDQPVSPVDDDVPTGDSSDLLNTVVNGEIADLWYCQSSYGNELGLLFLSGSAGVLVDTTHYPDGIEHRWSLQGDELSLTLTDGNLVSLSGLLIEPDYLYVDTLILNGADSGAIECIREQL